MVVFEIGSKVYTHQARDPTQLQVVQSKKAQRLERHELMLEACALLKESIRAEIQGDVGATQRLRIKAANLQTGAAYLHAHAATSLTAPPTPTTWLTEVELLEGLEAASYNLRRLMTNVCLSNSTYPLRNYRKSTVRYNVSNNR